MEEPIEIILGDGKVRHLRLTLGSLQRAGKLLGVSLLSSNALLELDERKLPVLVQAGLVERDGTSWKVSTELNADQVAELMPLRGLEPIVKALVRAMAGEDAAKNGASAGPQPAPAPEASPSIGSTSGPSASTTSVSPWRGSSS